MRIGVNCYQLLPDIGGLKQYFLRLFRELLENDNQNTYIFFYFSHNTDELSHLDDLNWQENAVELNDQQEVYEHLDKIDLYFCPFGALWPRPVPVPTVVTLVDIQEVFYPEYFSAQDLFNRHFHYRGSTKMADRVITISEFSRQTIVKHHKISPNKIGVIHLCADDLFYQERVVIYPSNIPLSNGEYIFYPANFWQHKNHDRLLKALKWLKTEKSLRINAVFTGHEVANGYPLSIKMREYGIENQIYNLGYVPFEQLAWLYSKAKLMVFPSLYEGFGMPLIEAMAAGCPVAASNATALPEIGGDAADYFDPFSIESIGSSIEKLWMDSARRNQLVERGYRRSQDFSTSRLTDRHIKIFQEAADMFSRMRYQWHRWVYQFYQLSLVALKHRR
ncbi:MAG: glycosyltransferase family 4 protein [Deltaproteobacteria bacterium]|nr:glycosyltransferase family 4 protein [Deltaproteobacteria bacterium]